MRSVLIVLAAFAATVQAQGIYGGPTIGGRGRIAGDRPGAPNGYTFFVGVSGDTDTGLTVATTDANGDLVPLGRVNSMRVNFGVTGVHRGRHSVYGLSYVGGITESNSSYITGSEHSLAFTTENRLSRRWSWRTDSSAGAMTRPFGAYYGFAGIDPTTDISGIQNQPLNSRFYYLQHQETVGYRLSARTELIGGGSVFKVQRADNFYSSFGYGGNAGIAHQFSARTTVTAQFQSLHYEYGHAYGSSNVQVVMVSLDRRLSARWNLTAGVGGLKSDLTGERLVKPDPVVVALFGNLPFIETFSETRYAPTFNLGVHGKYARWGIGATAARSVSPGNGIVRTSVNDMASVNYAYTGVRHWTFNINSGYSKYQALNENLQNNSSLYAGASASRYLGRNISFTARGDYRRYVISSVGGFRNNGTHFMAALTYQSRERPVNMW